MSVRVRFVEFLEEEEDDNDEEEQEEDNDNENNKEEEEDNDNDNNKEEEEDNNNNNDYNYCPVMLDFYLKHIGVTSNSLNFTYDMTPDCKIKLCLSAQYSELKCNIAFTWCSRHL